MELLQLRYFFESAKNENFSKTAQMFMVPTTSVSASIKRLEQELGCQLFDRSSNRIKLNAKGQLLQQTLCSVFHNIDQTVEQLSDKSKDGRQIKILVRSMRRRITDVIISYIDLHPDFSFQTNFDHGSSNYQDYDIVIDDEKECYQDYERIELYRDRLRLKCAASHPLRNATVSLSQLSNQSFVSMNPDSNTHKILVKACMQAGFTPHFVVHCNDIDCYEKFVAAGIGIGILRQSVNGESSENSLCDIDVTDFDPYYTTYAYYPKKEYYGNVQEFIHFLKFRSNSK